MVGFWDYSADSDAGSSAGAEFRGWYRDVGLLYACQGRCIKTLLIRNMALQVPAEVSERPTVAFCDIDLRFVL